MKKLIIAAAIVCAAAMSQAASCLWTLSAVADSPDATKAAGWTAYLVSASEYDTFTALSGDKVASWLAGITPVDTAETKSGGRGLYNISKTTGDNYGVGDSENAFLVLFNNASAADATYYAYTSTKQSAAVGDGGADIELPFGSFADATTGWLSTAGSPEPVPEPTSGLLLLLGVAGLALRRKQA